MEESWGGVVAPASSPPPPPPPLSRLHARASEASPFVSKNKGERREEERERYRFRASWEVSLTEAAPRNRRVPSR